MATRNRTITGSATGLTTSYAAVLVSVIPDSCEVSWLRCVLASISSATQVTMYLAADSAGDIPLTDEIIVDIVTGMTTATKGAASAAIDLDYAPASGGTSGSIWLVAKTDVGTATMTPEIVISEEL